MGIVTGLFRQFAPTLMDGLEAQGVIRSTQGLFDTRATPSTVPEMFIGGQGVANLERAGVIPEGEGTRLMSQAASDALKLDPEEWNSKWATAGFAYDPVAMKPMMEISDKNVTLKKGVDIDSIPRTEILGFDEVINAETLKKAYPEISNIKIGFRDDPESASLAAYSPEKDIIFFNREHPKWKEGYDPIRTVVHEVQHYVQSKEKLTSGEGFSDLLKQNENFQSLASDLSSNASLSNSDLRRAVDLFLRQNADLGFNKAKVASALEELSKQNGLSALTALERAFNSKDMAAKFVAFTNQNPQISSLIAKKEALADEFNRTYGDYLRVAGEVFARQTEQRRNLSGAERIERPAMREILSDPLNKKYNITLDNMTPSSTPDEGNLAYTNPFPSTI